jgi:protein-S-isoprenylcysteine O-methyltransferase Ste14
MLITVLVVLLFLSLGVELTCFHVPSVANTQVFFKSHEETINMYSKYRNIFYWSKNKKIALLLIPHFVNMTVFIIPLYYLFSTTPSINFWSVAGFMVALLGRSFTFYSMIYLRKNNSQNNDDFTLHDKGPFSKMRNPGLTGMLLFFLGLNMIWPSIIMAIALLYYFCYNHFRILIEEDFLKVMYKEKYIQYFKKVNRYF